MSTLDEERIREIIREELAAFYAKLAFPYPYPVAAPNYLRPCSICGIIGCLTPHVTCQSDQQMASAMYVSAATALK